VDTQSQAPTTSSSPASNAGSYSGLAIASFVLAFILAPAAVIVAIIALLKIRKTHQKGALLAWIVLVVCILISAYLLISAFSPGSLGFTLHLF
jgi:hypothetical protein